ncbi:MAG TPA: hypothetical protein VFN19_07130, partial [Candidatus Nanopelagicales bacterium]|nr:hypothetical protein [Candidatus Nanopelagicales bacterium]
MGQHRHRGWDVEPTLQQHWQGWAGSSGWGRPGGHGPHGGQGGPPPWVQGLLGWAQPGSAPAGGAGPRARRGDVRLAILAV